MDNEATPEGVTAEDLRLYKWQDVISKHPRKQSHSYAGPLLAEAERLKQQGDPRGFRTFAFLAKVASLHADYSNRGNPYEPSWRGPIDLCASGLDALENMIGEIQDSEFKARVGDILWEFRRRHEAAEMAVVSFVESAHRLEDVEHWPLFTERLERALALSAKLGRKKPLHVSVCNDVEASILKYKDRPEAGFLCARLIQMLVRQKRVDAAKFAKICRELAEQFGASEQWDQAHEYWDLCAKFGHPDPSAAKNALIQAAECWVRKAKANLAGEKPDHLFAAHWMGMGFQELRQAGAPDERQAEVHREFRELQKLGMRQMAPLALSDEIVEKVEALSEKLAALGKQHVRGVPFEKALFKLAFIRPAPDPDDIKRSVESETQQSVWMHIMPAATVTKSGLTADQIGPMPVSPGPERDEWLMKSAYFHARQFEWPHVAELIEVARVQINEEHPCRMEDLRFLITSNPFIPQGHEGIYLAGLHAGLVGDWLIAVHLLVPQLEASIRSVFEQRGIVTSTVESEGTQQERLLGKLLYHPQMELLFGRERTFNLRGILVEKFGFNLRNDMAHGFISELGFFSPAAPVLWWLVLQLCCIGHHLPTTSGAD